MDTAPTDSRVISSRALQLAYSNSNILFQFLLSHGWGPLLNLGYFDVLSPLTLFSLPVAQRRMVRRAVKLLHLHPDETVLDVACGRGWSSHHIECCYPVKSVVGIDFLENHVQVCRTLYENPPRLEYRQGDATDLRFERESFDAVICIEAAFHFDREKFMREAARVLKKGGRLVIVDFMWKTRPEQSDMENPHAEVVKAIWSWNDFDSVEEYRKHASDAGLRVKSMDDWSFRVTTPFQVLMRMLAAIGRGRAGRSLLTRMNPELRNFAGSDWQALDELVEAHDYMLHRSRYIALVLVKD